MELAPPLQETNHLSVTGEKTHVEGCPSSEHVMVASNFSKPSEGSGILKGTFHCSDKPSITKTEKLQNVSMETRTFYPGTSGRVGALIPRSEHVRRQHFHPLTDRKFTLTCFDLTPNDCSRFYCETLGPTPSAVHVLRCLTCLLTYLPRSVRSIRPRSASKASIIASKKTRPNKNKSNFRKKQHPAGQRGEVAHQHPTLATCTSQPYGKGPTID